MSPELLFYVQLLVILGLDMMLGDPRLLLHPIRFIGFLCTRFESLARVGLKDLEPRLQGVLTFVLVLVSSLLSLWLFLRILSLFSNQAAVAGACLVCYFCVAAGDLVKHSGRVRRHLDKGDTEQARQAVAMMVGRDTEKLDEAQISRACIESVSENLVDGITAPLFWALIGGLAAPGLSVSYIVCASFGFVAYKAVNTMDSMFGYKNERYIDFGRCAATTDDLCNFLPARLSGLCVTGAALLPGFDSKLAKETFFRDRLKSSSPNSAHTEAAVAGALGIRLGGSSSYFGEETFKPYLGDGLRQAEPADITRTNRLVLLSAVLFYLFGFGFHWIITKMLI